MTTLQQYLEVKKENKATQTEISVEKNEVLVVDKNKS
jgi:hypothetical protein